MGFGQFLNVISTMNQRVVVEMFGTNPHHVQQSEGVTEQSSHPWPCLTSQYVPVLDFNMGRGSMTGSHRDKSQSLHSAELMILNSATQKLLGFPGDI